MCMGRRESALRGSKPVYDRITSAPAKILMESVSRQQPSMQNHFKPLWREGIIQNTSTGTVKTVATWHVNIHKGRIRIEILPEFTAGVEQDMAPGLRRLQFGTTDEDTTTHTKSKGKGGGKAGGKGGKAKRAGPAIPLDPNMYRDEDGMTRTQLGNLQFSRYPFAVAIRKLEVQEENTRMDDSTKRRQQQEVHPNKRRSPTPEATYHPAAAPLQAPLQTQGQDPWAVARAAATGAAAASSSPSTALEGPIRIGDRISA